MSKRYVVLAFVLLWACLHPATRPAIVYLLIPGTFLPEALILVLILFIFVRMWISLGEQQNDA